MDMSRIDGAGAAGDRGRSTLTRAYDPSIGPLIPVFIDLPDALRGRLRGNEVPATRAEFLIDTGADTTCISPRLARQLHLVAVSKRLVSSATHGQIPANLYLVDIAIPLGDETEWSFAKTVHLESSVLVSEFNGPTLHFQGLLGRDILCRCHFTMGHDRRYTLSF
jgi:predicted aspartyl protease